MSSGKTNYCNSETLGWTLDVLYDSIIRLFKTLRFVELSRTYLLGEIHYREKIEKENSLYICCCQAICCWFIMFIGPDTNGRTGSPDLSAWTSTCCGALFGMNPRFSTEGWDFTDETTGADVGGAEKNVITLKFIL